MQALKAAPSRLQPNVTPASVAVKLKLGEALLLRASGLAVIVVSGGVLSTVTPTDEAAELLERSTACAAIVVAPSGIELELQLQARVGGRVGCALEHMPPLVEALGHFPEETRVAAVPPPVNRPSELSNGHGPRTPAGQPSRRWP